MGIQMVEKTLEVCGFLLNEPSIPAKANGYVKVMIHNVEVKVDIPPGKIREFYLACEANWRKTMRVRILCPERITGWTKCDFPVNPQYIGVAEAPGYSVGNGIYVAHEGKKTFSVEMKGGGGGVVSKKPYKYERGMVIRHAKGAKWAVEGFTPANGTTGMPAFYRLRNLRIGNSLLWAQIIVEDPAVFTSPSGDSTVSFPAVGSGGNSCGEVVLPSGMIPCDGRPLPGVVADTIKGLFTLPEVVSGKSFKIRVKGKDIKTAKDVDFKYEVGEITVKCDHQGHLKPSSSEPGKTHWCAKCGEYV